MASTLSKDGKWQARIKRAGIIAQKFFLNKLEYCPMGVPVVLLGAYFRRMFA
jgi:hypothetical protein